MGRGVVGHRHPQFVAVVARRWRRRDLENARARTSRTRAPAPARTGGDTFGCVMPRGPRRGVRGVQGGAHRCWSRFARDVVWAVPDDRVAVVARRWGRRTSRMRALAPARTGPH